MSKADRIAAAVAVAALAAAALGMTLRHRPTPAAEAVPAAIALAEGQGLRDDWPADEVFRRAFWRHPGTGDRIVHAVRCERSDDDGVNRWAWFIQLHPGPELLETMRDPNTFGLVAVENPRPWLPRDLRPPDWYPPPPGDPAAEIFQHPSQGMTLVYHPSANLLFACDHGGGFALPAAE